MGSLDGLEGRYVGMACWSFLFVLFIGFLSLYLFILLIFCFLFFFIFVCLTFLRTFINGNKGEG